MAGNSIKFAVHVLEAANPDSEFEPSKGLVRGVALAAAAFACIIHSVSRRGGIWLSNLFACVKVGILLVILALAIRIGILDKERGLQPSVVEENFTNAFSPPKLLPGCEGPLGGKSENGYARAFLSISESVFFHRRVLKWELTTRFIVFAFSGFDQANYVSDLPYPPGNNRGLIGRAGSRFSVKSLGRDGHFPELPSFPWV